LLVVPALPQPAAGDCGSFRLETPTAVAITERQLLTLRDRHADRAHVGGTVKELISAAAIGDIDSIGVKRLAVGYPITLTVRFIAITLEANAASRAGAFANTFERVTATRP
jgi:hypothetical protein